ncbi:hypothetical protein ABT121_35005 [Streptomyces sp. NPDC001928]|uniref:hypothetical protein n=1 Tax=Streptomyces sp. NPDC001928 TaxID=3154404 RepID=UPI00332D67DD
MGDKPQTDAAALAACVEQSRPWRRHGQRGIKITIIVIEILRVIDSDAQWDSPLEGALAAAIALLLLEAVYDAVRFVVSKVSQVVPERVVLDRRRNGRRRISLGW